MPSNVVENCCTYGIKSSAGVLAIGGIVLSILAARNCEFVAFVDTDGNPPDRADEPPFDTALAGSIGIFGYIITDVFNSASSGTNGCVAYQDLFGQQTAYPSIATAQFCSIIAPIFAGLGAFAAMFDLCIYNFSGSFMISSFLFLLACGIQAGTFTLLADPAFCLEDPELECSTGQGVYLSIGATIVYFLCAVLMCCGPRGDPFCYNYGLGPEQQRSEPGVRRVSERASETKIILQPIIVQTPQTGSNLTEESERSEPTKSPRNIKKKIGSSAENGISDESKSPRTPKKKKVSDVSKDNTGSTPQKSPKKISDVSKDNTGSTPQKSPKKKKRTSETKESKEDEEGKSDIV